MRKKKLKSFEKRGKERGILTKKEARYPIPEAAKTLIYYVPKIHKSIKSSRQANNKWHRFIVFQTRSIHRWVPTTDGGRGKILFEGQ